MERGVGHRPLRLTLQVEATLSDRIRRGVYPGGCRLTEAKLADELGVSRTVVREAINRLNAAGLAETRHGVGTVVLELPPFGFDTFNPEVRATLSELQALLELRITLETEAAALAAARRSDAHVAQMREILDRFEASRTSTADTVRADFDFHLKISEASGNCYFVDIMSRLGIATIPRSRLVGAANDPRDLRRIEQYHHDIYEAIRGRDPETARLMMRLHLIASRERVRRAQDAALAAIPPSRAEHGDDDNANAPFSEQEASSAAASVLSR